ncbi:MAG: 4'-phosphopantetheinyl transferase superfamily protein [Lachnospiraceae bacterium]|nr:4'-phosphopantetheinyl transferase superfamily protein [Lachnospiraceae bacterium]
MDKVDICAADYEILGLEQTWEELLLYLDPSDKEKTLRFKFEADRIRSVAGACLIKANIKRAFPDEEIKTERTELGKPYISGKKGYQFNLSHSGRMIVFASDSSPVGVDVEAVREKDWRIFHRFLTEKEMAMIESSGDPEGCFFEVWTIREAFAKEEGEGLGLIDKPFIVDYDRRVIEYGNKTLYFKTFEHMADIRYKVSICSPHDISGAELKILTPEDWDGLRSLL